MSEEAKKINKELSPRSAGKFQPAWALLLILCLPARAQWSVGVGQGVGWDRISRAPEPKSKTTPLAGYLAEIQVEWVCARHISLSLSASYNKKNYEVARTGALSGEYQQFRNGYIQMPLIAHFFQGNRWRFFGGVGMYIGYWTSGRTKGKIADIFSVTDSSITGGQTFESYRLVGFNTAYTFNKVKDRRWEAGWASDVGIQFRSGTKFVPFAKASYYYSLSDQQKAYMTGQSGRYNREVTLSLGVMYLLP